MDSIGSAVPATPARWWVAVPDRPDADRFATALVGRFRAGVLARHASGRVWLCGRYPDRLVDAVGAGPIRVVVIGVRGRTAGELRDAEGAAARGRDELVDRVVRRPGVATVAVSAPGRIQVYTDAVGSFPASWTRHTGTGGR
ncbi:MAG TPA: hypothetical protein VFX70_14470, partial [Mycobacteriales bacterium]|nr:hypothetical protein [Mycobacteriales bacterium]